MVENMVEKKSGDIFNINININDNMTFQMLKRYFRKIHLKNHLAEAEVNVTKARVHPLHIHQYLKH